MITAPSRARPRPRWWSGALCISAVALGVQSLPAQVPDTLPADIIRGDTLPADTAAQDTAAQDTTAQDSLAPPPTLPDLGMVGPTGWAAGVWHWDREDLLRLPNLSLLDLIERIPGITPVRTAYVGQPEGAAVFGSAAGALTYVLDGFELDPLTTPTLDAARIALVALESVRVERRVTGMTVYLETLTPTDARAHSIIEAATADFDTNLFRGTFLAPRVAGGSLGLGFERLASDAGRGSSSHMTGWLKYTLVRDSAGIQFELRQGDSDQTGVGDGLLGARRDWLMRARAPFGPVLAEAYAGATTVEDEVGSLALREGTPQGGLRLRTRTTAPFPVEARVALRLRSHPRLPQQELELDAWARPQPWLGVGVGAVRGWWDGSETTGRVEAEVQAGPFFGVSAFAGLSRGGGPFGPEVLAFEPDGGGIRVPRDGARAGLQVRIGGFMAGAAAISTTATEAHGFGLAFDPEPPEVPSGEARGVEGVLRVPTWLEPVWLEGSVVSMDPPAPWLYMPDLQWRAAAVYRHLPLPSGNLELYARLEHEYRGAMTVPLLDDIVEVEPYRATNFELVIRVVTVRAFIRWGNVLHRQLQRDLVSPEEGGYGYALPGQHVQYGVKWEFWN